MANSVPVLPRTDVAGLVERQPAQRTRRPALADQGQRALGEGEVQATLNAEGISKIHETRVPGVWWVEHRDQHGEVIAELIEVTRVPEILASAADEVAAGARDLRAHISASAAPLPGGSHGSHP